MFSNRIMQKTRVEIKKIIKNTSFQNNQFNDNVFTNQEKFRLGLIDPYCDDGRVLVD